jgi:hypothetical protein
MIEMRSEGMRRLLNQRQFAVGRGCASVMCPGAVDGNASTSAVEAVFTLLQTIRT